MPSLVSLRSRPDYRLFLLEAVANYFWVLILTLSTLLTLPPLLPSLHPTLTNFSPPHLFLPILSLISLLWHFLSLSLSSPLNPCLSLCLHLTSQLPFRHLLVHLSAHFFSHYLAILSLSYLSPILPAHLPLHLPPPKPDPSITPNMAILLEAFATFLLCLATLVVPHISKKDERFRQWVYMTIPIVTALTITAELTGGCMNPALAWALAYIEDDWHGQQVYWLGPISGAIAASVVYNNTISNRLRAKQDQAKSKIQ